MEDGEQNQSDQLCSSKPRGRPNLFIWIFLVIALGAVIFFARSTLCVVGAVIVEGNSSIAQEDIFRVAGIPDRVNIFRLDPEEIRARLAGDLRISTVEVSRSFPATIVIRISERKPLFYVATNYGFAEVDRQGMILSCYKGLRQVKVPIVTGVALANQYVGETIPAGPIEDMLRFLDNLDTETFQQIAEVNIRTDGCFVAYTTHPIQIRLGTRERMADKARFASDILQEINQKKLAIEYIDLNSTAPIIKAKK
ncbi:MAG: ftsQ [Firmicutes bacterium]|nr:ftsQ [Bacillota bacterium]